MSTWWPLMVVGGIVGFFTVIFIIAYFSVKDRKESMGFDRNMKDSDIFKRLLHYARPYRLQFIGVLILMLMSIAYDIISPIIFGNVTELVRTNAPLRKMYIEMFKYGSILIVSMVSTYVQTMVLQKIGQKIISSIREETFSHIEGLSHNQLNKIPVGKLVTRVTNDTDAISQMFTNILINLVKNVFVVTGVLIAMLLVNYELTLMVLCFAPFLALFTLIFRRFSRRAHRKTKTGNTDINTFLSENLSGMKIIQAYNCQESKKKEFDGKNKFLKKAKSEMIFVFSIFRPIVYMLYVSSVLCLLYLGGRGAMENTRFLGQAITGATIVTFYLYIFRFFSPIQTLAEQFNRLQSAFASAEKVFSILDIEIELKDAPDAIEMPEIKGEIEFRHVWFKYVEDDDLWILKDVSFKVNAGETVAFVGATGAGKTTILALICRNYDIQKGEILLDGVDIRKIKISSLRSHFGQMLQDVFLFSGTVRTNLTLGNDEYTDEQINDACKYVNADSFINQLPGGLDEEVRERGNNFSAGQRQLISFARTVLHRPEIMILDEATANIDTETEILIQNSLEKMMNIGTMLVVAHRLSTVRNADRIIVMSHGEIVEQGSHSELIEQGGAYYELYKLQSRKAELLK